MHNLIISFLTELLLEKSTFKSNDLARLLLREHDESNDLERLLHRERDK